MDISLKDTPAPHTPPPAETAEDKRAARGVTRLGDRVFLGLSRGSGIFLLVLMAAIAVFLSYRAALAIRRAEPALGDGGLDWIATDPEVLAFRRGEDFVCIANLGPHPVALPAHRDVILTSRPLEDGLLPTDSTAWLRR